MLENGGGMEKHFLLKSHPTLAGLFKFHFTLRMQHCGLALINQWYDAPQLAYLYNICQQTGHKGLCWPDMDAFIAMHGVEHIFVGGRPKTAEESTRKLRLATGVVTAAELAPGARRTQPSNNGEPRLMQPSNAVVKLFEDRYMCNMDNKMSIDRVDKLLEEIAPKKARKKASKSSKKATSPSKVELVRQSFASTKRLGALQLLAAIKQGLSVEEPVMHFNYFGMHKRCIEILRLIEEKEKHKFVQYFGNDYMPDDTLIANLVMLILTVAERSKIASQMFAQPRTSGTTYLSRMVVSCEDVMVEYLKKNGDKACKEVKAFCKNQYLGEDTGLQVQATEDGYWFSLEGVLDPAMMAHFQTGISL